MSLELKPPDSLAAPEPLQVPASVPTVPEDQAGQMVKLDPVTTQDLDKKVDDFVKTVETSQVNSPTFTEKVNAIHNLGSADIRASANVSNRLLDKPVKSLDAGLFDSRSDVAKSLTDLRKTVEDLDPSKQGDLFTPKKIFGIIPAGDHIRDYFLKYQSSQTHINAILNTLYHSQDELRKDNAAIEEEKVNLWNIMQRLQQYIYVGRKIDGALDARVQALQSSDPEKARVVREEMLFYVRQKVQDLLTQLAVSIQGYLALDMVRKNNLELIKGVDRATTTTVSALRTAVIVAQALANQKLVLDQINTLNTTTSNLIASTSELMKKQSGEVYQQASSSTINLEQLQKAFDNIYQSMDRIDAYKDQALGNMQQTVNALTTQVAKAQTYLDRVRTETASGAVADVNLDDNKEVHI